MPVICSWTLALQDMNGHPTFLSFDLFDDNSPLIIGLDVSRYATTDFLSDSPRISFRRPSDNETRIFPIYIRSESSICARAYIDLIFTTSRTLLATTKTVERPLSFDKRLHRFSHGPVPDLIRLIRRAGIQDSKLEEAVEMIGKHCDACARSGAPVPSKKISLKRVNMAFNRHLQADFMFCFIKGRRHCVLHAVDAATSYSETKIVTSRSACMMANTLENIWITRHGAPENFASDFEFQSAPMKSFLASHSIKLDERPVRRHNKTGVVERKHLTVKRILERLQLDTASTDDDTILARATFFQTYSPDPGP